MPKPFQLPQDKFFYKGIWIRSRTEDGWVSISDLWKSEGSPWKVRPDIWAKRDGNRQFLEAAALKIGAPVWTAFKGGNTLQGTFAAPEVAVKYAADLSLECSDWLCGVLDNSSVTGKAKRRTIHLGDIPLEVFQLPSGEYKLSQTQAAEAIEKDERSFREFLGSKSPEALPYKGFESAKLAVEDSNVPINPIPVRLAIAYWTKESLARNVISIRLLAACAVETIERRADKAFGVQRTEDEYNQRFRSASTKLVDFFPEYARAVDPVGGSGTSMVLAEKKLFRSLKRKFPSEIFKLPKESVLQDLVLLGAQANFHLAPEQAIAYPDGAANRNAYPDLISQPSDCVVDGRPQRVVLLFHYFEPIVNENHVRDCVYLREYVDRVKISHQVDHALLFLVSPYGIARYAAACIKEKPELSECVGVITLQHLSKFLLERASHSKQDNIRLGRLKRRFSHLMDYKTLDELLGQDNLSKLSVQSSVQPNLQLDLFAS